MKNTTSGSTDGEGGASPSQLIDARIKELSDWRGETLARIRMLITQADPEVVEEWKWRGVPEQLRSPFASNGCHRVPASAVAAGHVHP